MALTRNEGRLALAAAGLAAAGAFVQVRTRIAERANPPLGRFLTVGDVRLHYLDEGDGPTLVLLHGLGSMVEDFVLSGLLRRAAERYRVIAFDRPGYGHSGRPGRWRFGPIGQARLFREALRRLGANRPIVLGHSWGTRVAVAMALEHPGWVRSMVLASGLYFPSLRLDASALVPPAIPILGDLMRHTVSPLVGRLAWPAWVRTIFAPAPVPAAFDAFPAWMALRPSQLYATAEDAFFTLPATARFARRYASLTLPLVLVAGRRDRYVHMESHTLRLHRMLPSSTLLVSEGAGHMVHHSDLPLVLDALALASAPAAGVPAAETGIGIMRG